jgi:hypothetical protein
VWNSKQVLQAAILPIIVLLHIYISGGAYVRAWGCQSTHRAFDGCSRLQRLGDSRALGSAKAYTVQEQSAVVHQHYTA